MEMMEDDLLFADLSKQISLLLMDEGDGDVAVSPPWHSPHLLQGQGQGQGQQPRKVQEQNHHRSKGTGVFIPRFAPPVRKITTPFHRHNRSSRPTYRHQPIDYYNTPRRFSQEGSKASYYFINADKDLIDFISIRPNKT